MSKETERLLGKIEARLESIDERLGMLLLSTNDRDKQDVESLHIKQAEFQRAETNLMSELDYLASEHASALEADIAIEQAWLSLLGIERPSDQIHDGEWCEINLNFCDLANRYKYSLGKNYTHRYNKLRRLLRGKKYQMRSGSPYNKFLSGKTPPNEIKIDCETADLLVGILIELIREKKLKQPS